MNGLDILLEDTERNSSRSWVLIEGSADAGFILTNLGVRSSEGAVGFSLWRDSGSEADSDPRSHSWSGDCRLGFLLLLFGLLQNTQEVRLLGGREKPTGPCPLRMGYVGVVRGSGNHRFNVSCSAPPGCFCVHRAAPSRDCCAKWGQSSRLGLWPAPLVPPCSGVSLPWGWLGRQFTRVFLCLGWRQEDRSVNDRSRCVGLSG